MKHHTWANTQRWHSSEIHQPHNETELQATIRKINQRGGTARVLGSGHSCNAIAVSDQQHVISLDQFNQQVIGHSEDQVTVAAGTTLHQLNQQLNTQGLALPNLGTISAQTIAGAISTGTHGSGIQHGGLHTMVKAVRMVLGDGEIAEFSLDDNRDDFYGSVLSLGMLGVMTTLKLQCVPAFNLEVTCFQNNVEDLKRHFSEYLSSDYFHALLIPHTGQCLVCLVNKTNKPTTKPTIWQQMKPWLIDNYLLEFLLFFHHQFGLPIKKINQLLLNFLNTSKKNHIDLSYKMLNIPIRIKQHVMEYAIPVEQTLSAVTDIQSLLSTEKYAADFPIELRFVKKDHHWLSPAYERDSCYIGFIKYKPYNLNIDPVPFFKPMESLLLNYAGRPHWAKHFYITGQELSEMYSKWQNFLSLRDRCDPGELFMNSFLKAIFKKR